jgi:signal transduction histidine kinase/ActR/RegA family two-component response regulator
MSGDHEPASGTSANGDSSRRLGIGLRVGLASAILAIAVAVPAVLQLRATDSAREARDSDDRADRVIAVADLNLRLLVDLETGARGYLLTGDERFLEPWVAARSRLPAAGDDLVASVNGESEHGKLARAIRRESLSYLRNYSDPLVSLARRDRRDAARLVRTGQGKTRVDRLRTHFADLTMRQAAFARRQRDAAAKQTATATRIGIGGLVLALVLVGAFGAYLAGAISRPLKRLAVSAKLLRDGDLSPRVQERGPRELVDLTRAFNQMAAALQVSQHQLEQASHAKNEFLSRVSHELRTPLNAIIGFGQLLEMDDLPEDQEQSVEQILVAGRHLLDLINEILEISRIESGDMRLSVEPVAVDAAVREVLALVTPAANARDIVLSDGDVASDIHVLADQQRLKQILLNLLSNAIKYNREGGRVEMRCRTAGDRVAIAVHDTGAGMTQEQLEGAFVPFERLGADRGAIEGTGLGLSLSRRLAEAMGGTLEAQSTPGEGSTFTLRVRRTAALVPSEPDGLAPAADEPIEGERQTVLYVEDNRANLELVARIFDDRRPVRLLTATHAKQGLEIARRERPDLVLLDVHLSDLSGHEVLARLRADPATAGIPVVVLSADATQGQRRRLVQAGAEDYVTKPLDVRQFLRVVDRALAVTPAR